MSATKASSGQQRQQFAALTERLELSIPGDGEERVFAAYLQLLQMTRLVRHAHHGADEPALVFSTAAIARDHADV